MKRLNLEIKVCLECPYYDDAYEMEGYDPWCHKSERDMERSFVIPDWCVLEECYDGE